MKCSPKSSQLRNLLGDLATEHDVPGASIAVMQGETIDCASAGIANVETRIDVTDDTLFQIGSITKLFTATLIMRLVSEGKLRLCDPIGKHLPELILTDGKPGEGITVQRVLSHSSGLDGDLFVDTGDGADCLAAYLSYCTSLGLIAAPGSMVSYSNAGYVLLGRIVEKLTGLSWAEALEQRILMPLKLSKTIAQPRYAPRYRVAAGHVDGHLAVPAFLPRSGEPAGSRLMATACDLLEFARCNILANRRADREQVIGADLIAQMQKPQLAFPFYDLADAWGLGWMLFDWNGTRLVGHDGTTIGQRASLRICPETKTVVAILANSICDQAFFSALHATLFKDLAGLGSPDTQTPVQGEAIDLSGFGGIYENAGNRIEVVPTKQDLTVMHSFFGLARVAPSVAHTSHFSVRHIQTRQGGHALFSASEDKTQIAFLPNGAADQWDRLHFSGRLYHRRSPTG